MPLRKDLVLTVWRCSVDGTRRIVPLCGISFYSSASLGVRCIWVRHLILLTVVPMLDDARGRGWRELPNDEHNLQSLAKLVNLC